MVAHNRQFNSHGIQLRDVKRTISTETRITPRKSPGTKQIFRQVKEWNEDSIKQRAEYLGKRAVTVWPYFGPDKDSKKEDDFDVTGKTPNSLTILGETI